VTAAQAEDPIVMAGAFMPSSHLKKLTKQALSQVGGSEVASARPKSCFESGRSENRSHIYTASQRLKNNRNKIAAKLIADLEDTAAASRAGDYLNGEV
jgi:hypothetical protein